MKRIKNIFLICLFLFLACLVNNSWASNPFLSGNKSKENPYLSVNRTIYIVFDASRSMEEKINGETKIHIAKHVLEDVLLKAPQDVNIGLRVYGASKPSGNPYIDCSDSKLLVLAGKDNRRAIISEIHKILPRGFTPITYSLSQASQDLTPYKGEKSIILISDGLETCGGDPCQLSQTLVSAGIDLKVDVVGFGIRDNFEAQQQLMCIALSTNGKYFSAENADELTRGLTESINKSVTGRIITMVGKEYESTSEETEGYQNLPMLQAEKLILKKKK